MKFIKTKLNEKLTKKLDYILIATLMLLIITGVGLNYYQKMQVDDSKLPEKVELSKGFQKWITNLKNKEFDISADEFRFKEEAEIYNNGWMKVYSVDELGRMQDFEKTISEAQTIEQSKTRDAKFIEFSPSKRQFIDFRPYDRGVNPRTLEPFFSNEARFYGMRDDKIIDARILDCSKNANCFFDRGFFLNNTNDLFVITEISRNINKKEQNPVPCDINQECEYTIKVHMIDLVNNKRIEYESEVYTINLEKTIPEL